MKGMKNEKNAPEVASLLYSLLTPMLERPMTASISSSSLSSEVAPLPLVRMSLPTPIPKLGIRGPAAGRLPPVRNLMLPT